MARVKTRLVQGLTEEEKEHFTQGYKASNFVRSVLVDVLRRELDFLLKDEESFKALKGRHWHIEKAYELGRRKALRDAIDLLSQDL